MRRERRGQGPHIERKSLPLVGQPLYDKVAPKLNAEGCVGLGQGWGEVQMALLEREVAMGVVKPALLSARNNNGVT